MSSPDSAPVIGIVLAAGRSTRTGFPKALAKLEGETFIGRSLRTLRACGCAACVVVVAEPHGQAVADAVRRVDPNAREAVDGTPPTASGVQTLLADNPHPERGMLSSLRIGIACALAAWPEAGSFVLSLVDHPRARPETVRELVRALHRTNAPSVRPVFGGRGGHPVALAGRVAAELLDSPATTVREALGKTTDLPVNDPAVLEDADTRAAIEALGGSLGET